MKHSGTGLVYNMIVYSEWNLHEPQQSKQKSTYTVLDLVLIEGTRTKTESITDKPSGPNESQWYRVGIQ